MKHLIATLMEDDLPPGRMQLVPFRLAGRERSLLVLRRQGVVYAWLNECPHWSLPLGDQPRVIYDRSTRELRCTTHDARFRLEDGVCTWGPCLGDTLEPVPCALALGRIFLYLPVSLRSVSV